MERIGNGVRRRREERRLTQRALADAAGASRQTVVAVEAGRMVPSTALALRLARALGCAVDELFWLPEPAPLAAELAGAPAGRRVLLGEVLGRWVAHPLAADFSSLATAADGLLERRSSRVRPLAPREALAGNLIVIGCDPALGLLAARLLGARLRWVHAGSTAALAVLARGHAHVAGAHLYDEASGEFNLPFARRALGGAPFLAVTLARWREGLAVAPRNPRGIRTVEDLARGDVHIVNREAGAGARRLLDRALGRAGVPARRVRGYRRIARGHLAVAQAVALGAADAGVVAEAAALSCGLGFVPLAEERSDLIIPSALAADERVRRLLDALAAAPFRRELSAVAGYDVRDLGRVIAG